MRIRWLLAVVQMMLIAGCTSGITKDGTTVISYCLLGGVYVDDSRVEHNAEYKEAKQCL